MKKLNNLAIITARSGSKGLKDKNIKLLNKKPLMVYSIEAAIKSEMFDEVIVSTDSDEYADIAKKYGASVPFLRSEKNSADYSSSWSVVREVINEYKHKNFFFNTVTILQPTSPLRISEDIINAYNLLEEKKANFVVSVCEMEHSPLWSGVLDDDCNMKNFIDEKIIGKPRQNLPTYYRINGAIYIAKCDYLEQIDNMYNLDCYAYIMPKERSIDIDTEYDFKLAEYMFK